MANLGSYLGDGSEDLNAKALDMVADLLHDAQPGSMVQSFVLMVVTIDSEDRFLSSFTAPGQKSWESMGLLQFGIAAENAVPFGRVVYEDDDDDEDLDP